MISNELLKEKVLEKYIVKHCLNLHSFKEIIIEHPNYKKSIEVPENWKLVQIGNSGLEFTNGNYSSKYPKAEEFVDSGIPFIRANNIKDLSIVESSMYYITPEKHEFLSKGHLKTNDIIVAIRGSIGLCAIVPQEYNDSNLNAQLTVLRCNDKIIPKFLLYQISSKFVQQQFGCYITGAALKQLSEKNLQKCFILIPPIEEQQMIVDMIDEIFELITIKEKNDQLKRKLKQSLKDKILYSALHGSLIDNNSNLEPVVVDEIKSDIPFEIPSNWKWCNLKKCCDKLYAGGDKTSHFSKEKTDEYQIPVIANGVTNDGIIGYTDVPTETEACITISGRGTIGYTSIRNYPFSPIVRLITLKPKYFVEINYLKYVLSYLVESSKGTSIQQLTIPMIKDKLVPVPPLEEQKRIVEKIESLFELIEQL